jgi:hypothetical protein
MGHVLWYEGGVAGSVHGSIQAPGVVAVPFPEGATAPGQNDSLQKPDFLGSLDDSWLSRPVDLQDV